MTDGSSLPWYREQAVQAGFAAKNAILEAQQVAESPRLAISREWWAKTDARRAATFARLADFLDHLGCASLEDVEALLTIQPLHTPECPYQPYEDAYEAPDGVECSCPPADMAHRWKARAVLERAARRSEVSVLRAALERTELFEKEQPMSEQIPSIGRIVHYRLSADDAAQINRRRTTGTSIAERMKWSVAGRHHSETAPQGEDGSIRAWPAGAQAHIGNVVEEGDTFPMLITRTWGSTPGSAVNGQVFLDGNDVLWATSVQVGEGPRTFSWPTRS